MGCAIKIVLLAGNTIFILKFSGRKAKKGLTNVQKYSIINELTLRNVRYQKNADMAELADAHGSGPCESNFMQVQVLLSAPKKHTLISVFFSYKI